MFAAETTNPTPLLCLSSLPLPHYQDLPVGVGSFGFQLIGQQIGCCCEEAYSRLGYVRLTGCRYAHVPLQEPMRRSSRFYAACGLSSRDIASGRHGCI